MASKKIIDYIELCLGKGYKLDDIIDKLKKSGWSEDQIHEAIDVFTETVEVPRPAAKPEPKAATKPRPVPQEKPVKPQRPAPSQQPIRPQRPLPAPQTRQDVMRELWEGEPGQAMQPVPGQVPSQPAVPGQPQEPPAGQAGKGAKGGMAVSLVAGIMMLVASISNLLVSFLKLFPYSDLEVIYTLGFLPLDGEAITASMSSELGQILVFVSVAFSALAITGAAVAGKPGKAVAGGSIVLAASVVNLVAFWGLGMLGIIGGFLGIAGGILGILKK